jgi:hypothetical protein
MDFKGWSIECLYDWKVYLKLAIPAVICLMIEWSNFEIGSFASGLSVNQKRLITLIKMRN